MILPCGNPGLPKVMCAEGIIDVRKRIFKFSGMVWEKMGHFKEKKVSKRNFQKNFLLNKTLG